MKCSLGISHFLEEISSLSHSVVFLYFFALIAEEAFFYLFLLFFGTLHSDAYIFPLLLCFSFLFFSQLFVRPPQTAMVEVVKIMATSFKTSHAGTITPSAPSPAEGHCQPLPPPETPGHSWASLGQSLVGSLLLSPGSWCTRFCLCLPRVCFPVLCKFWQPLWWS